MSGTRADRPGLAKTLEMLREGDTLVVWKLDRLGRSVKQLVDLVGDLHKHGVQFRSLTDSIDTGTPSGRFFFHVMASLAEMERELTVERTRAGLEVAKLGRKGGRKPKMTDSKIESAKKLLASGCRPRTWPRTSACPFRRCTAGCQPPRTLSVLYFPFSETTPYRADGDRRLARASLVDPRGARSAGQRRCHGGECRLLHCPGRRTLLCNVCRGESRSGSLWR